MKTLKHLIICILIINFSPSKGQTRSMISNQTRTGLAAGLAFNPSFSPYSRFDLEIGVGERASFFDNYLVNPPKGWIGKLIKDEPIGRLLNEKDNASLNWDNVTTYPFLNVRQNGYSAGFFYNQRSIGALTKFPGQFISDAIYKVDSSQFNLLKPFQTTDINILRWKELGINGTKQFNVGPNRLTFGATAKYIWGKGFYLKTDPGGEYRLEGDSTITITKLNGEIGSANSGRGVSFDLGINWALFDSDTTNVPSKTAYKMRLGASLMNLGRLNFKANNATNYAFSVNDLNVFRELNELANLDTLKDESIELIEAFVDSLDARIDGNDLGKLKMRLPTYIGLHGDFRIARRFYVAGSAQISVSRVRTSDMLMPTTWSISPRYEGNLFSVSVPYTSFNKGKSSYLGVAFSVWSITFGSDRLINFTNKGQRFKGTDFYIGASFGIKDFRLFK